MADDPTPRLPTILQDARRARSAMRNALDAADIMADHISRLLEAACLGERPARRRGVKPTQCRRH